MNRVRTSQEVDIVTDKTEVTPVHQLVLPMKGVAKVLGIGETRAWGLIASGELPSVRIGRSRRVPVEAIREYVERLQREQNTQADTTK
jgi:excisionase family DNA binding protein